jgi:hypothetical protein
MHALALRLLGGVPRMPARGGLIGAAAHVSTRNTHRPKSRPMHTTMMTSMSMEGLGRLVRKKVRSPLVNTRRLREPDGHP